MGLFWVRNDAEEQNGDRYRMQDERKWASTKMSPSRIPVPQMRHRVCSSSSNIFISLNPDFKHRAGIPAILRAEIPDPSHLCKLATARENLHRLNSWCTWIHTAAINVMHLLIWRDIEPVRPEPDSSRNIDTPPQVLQAQGREVVIDHIDDQVLIALVGIQVQFVEEGIPAHFVQGQRSVHSERFKPPKPSPVQTGDFRDWNAIAAWARTLAGKMGL
jgi:hypothetical protein